MPCSQNSQTSFVERSEVFFPVTESSFDSIDSWYRLRDIQPRNPLDIIENASINGNSRSFAFIATFHKPPTGKSWTSSPYELTGVPLCVAFGTDNLENVANADQWNFQHLTRSIDPYFAPVFSNLIFLRAGNKWQMDILIDLGGLNYNDLVLSFLMNAATRGDAQGTMPVIQWAGVPWTGIVTLEITFHEVSCEVQLGLRGIDSSSGNPCMCEMHCFLDSK